MKTELKEQFKGVGSVVRGLDYEIFSILESNMVNPELLEPLQKLECMVSLLEEYLQLQHPKLVERTSVEYLFEQSKKNLVVQTVKSFCTKSDSDLVFSRNDISYLFQTMLEELNLMY